MKTRLLMIILSIVCGLSLTTSVTSITLDVVDDTKEELEVINFTLAELESLDTILEAKIKSLETKLTSLETELASIEDELNNTISEEIAGVKAELTAAITSAKEELEADVNAVKAEIKTLKDKDIELNNKITSLNDTLTSLINNNKTWVESTFVTIASCNQIQKDIKDLINTIDTKVKALETSINSVGDQVKTINTTLIDMKAIDEELNGKVASLEAKVITIETELVDVNASITALDSTHNAKLTELKTSLENELASLKTEIALLKTKDIALTTKITELELSISTKIDDLSQWVIGNYTTIDSYLELKDEIQTLISELDTRVSSLETSLTTLNTSLEVLQEKVEEHETEINELVDRVNCLYGIHKGTLQVRYLYDDLYENATAEEYYDCCDTVNFSEQAQSHYNNSTVEYIFIYENFEDHTVDLTDGTNKTAEDFEKAIRRLAVHEGSDISITLNDDSERVMYKAIGNALKDKQDINLTINGVENLPDFALNNDEGIFSFISLINLPDTIYIGNRAFYANSHIKTINAPKVKVIDENAFAWSGIDTLYLPLVEEIKQSAFEACSKLNSIDLPSCKTIGMSSFVNCDISVANIPNVTTIGISSFGYNDFTEINLPSVTSIGDYAFYGNVNLRKVEFGQPLVFVGLDIFESISIYVVDTTLIDLVLRSGQKEFTGSNIDGWTLSENDLAAGSNTFIGYTFKSIEIKPYTPSIEELEITGCEEEYIYTGSKFTPEISIVFQDKLLVEDVDYTLTYGENIYVGQGSIIITLQGNYAGVLAHYFEIIQDPATGGFDGEWV